MAKVRVSLDPGTSSSLLEFLRQRHNVERVSAVMRETQPASSVWAFSERVAKKAGLTTEEVRPIVRVLWDMSRGVSNGAPIDELLSQLIETLKESRQKFIISSWTPELIAQLEGTLPALKAAVIQNADDSPLAITSKANFLAYHHANVLNESRIISDIRPVFTSDGQQIKEMIITHSLVLTYRNSRDEKTQIHMTLDARDVTKLKENCIRAELKAKIIVDSLRDSPWNTVVFPEEADA